MKATQKQQQSILNSTYGIKYDWSYKGEDFWYVPLTWKLGVSRIEALKIRIAKWTPKSSRSNQAIFYYDVKTKDEASIVLSKFIDFNFKKLENRFDELYEIDRCNNKCTGDTQKWLNDIIPMLRKEFVEQIG